MDRTGKGRRVGNRNRTAGKKTTTAGTGRRAAGRRAALANRRNRRLGVRRNRNRLAGAQNRLGTNRRFPPSRRFRRFNFFNRRRNLGLRIVFVGGLPLDVGRRRLYTLFRKEGRIVSRKVVYNRNGFSRGYGFIEFRNPRDAWRAIQKWNNTTLGGRQITVEYRKRRRINRRRFGNNNYGFGYNRSGFNNYGGFNQRQGFGFRGGRGGFRGGFRQRRY